MHHNTIQSEQHKNIVNSMEEAIWLKTMPLAPVYRPTLEQFMDPVSYIFKIEAEASKFGICKIVPPVLSNTEKNILTNLNKCLSSANLFSKPTFSTRVQQVGLSGRMPRKPPAAPMTVWESGVNYNLPKFRRRAKEFAEEQLGEGSRLMALQIETLYWKAQVEKAIYVEYANDMPGSVFDEPGAGGVKLGKREVSDVMTLDESPWNLRRTARADGSLLKFLKEEIAGVTSPMVYLGMLYSWFAWHVEDHDLHSVNYMHMGAGKTWYGVPMESAFAFEEAICKVAYRGEMSPLDTFATLAEKTTVVSPEVLVKAGVPCYRLVQNPGEFVVTFPRAYHSGFSLGFNCAEAVNFATPGWLIVAQEAAIRRVSTDTAPMVSHHQLLYDLAMSLSLRPEPQSSRMRDRLKPEGEAFVKRTFMEDVMRNNELLDALGNGYPITILSEDVLQSLVVHDLNLNLNFDSVVDRRPIKRLSSSYGQPNKKVDPETIFSCVTCGAPCYSCVAIVQPSETAAQYLMSNADVNVMDPGLSSGKSHHSLQWANGYTMEGPSAYRKPSFLYNGPMDSAGDIDSSRMHLFCLKHAREVEQRLRPVGGVRMLLLCHQDYREMNDAARLISRELGISDEMWTDIRYIEVTEHDKMMIQRALDDEETTTGNQDWAVKLGIDIFYSAKLGRTPSYKKQMPNNAVISMAFPQYSPSNKQMPPKYPLNLARDDDKQQDHEKVSVLPKPNVEHERPSMVRKSTRKRKMTLKGMFLEVEASQEPLSPTDSPLNYGCGRQKSSNPIYVFDKATQESDVDSGDESDYNPTRSSKRKIKSKKNLAKKAKTTLVVAISDDEEGAFGCDLSFKSKEDLKTHKQNIGRPMAGCEKEPLVPHRCLSQYSRVDLPDHPQKCPMQGCELTFKCVSARADHVVLEHLRERHYVCVEDGCGQTFVLLSQLYSHSHRCRLSRSERK